jgi:hypothetical protein
MDAIPTAALAPGACDVVARTHVAQSPRPAKPKKPASALTRSGNRKLGNWKMFFYPRLFLPTLASLRPGWNYCRAVRDDSGYVWRVITFYANNQVVSAEIRPRVEKSNHQWISEARRDCCLAVAGSSSTSHFSTCVEFSPKNSQ